MMKATNCLDSQVLVIDQNFTWVALDAAEKQFPGSVQNPIDRGLGRSLAALLSFEIQPDQPTVDDLDHGLSFQQ